MITINQLDYSNDELDYKLLNEVFMRDTYTIVSNSSDVSLSFIFENKMHTYIFYRHYENEPIYTPYYETVNYVCISNNDTIVSFDLQFDNVKDLPCIDKAMKIINKTMENVVIEKERYTGNCYLNYCDHITRYLSKYEQNEKKLYGRESAREIEQNIIFPIFICSDIKIGILKSSSNDQYIYMCIFNTIDERANMFVVRFTKYKSDSFGLNIARQYNGSIETNLLCDNKNKKYHIKIFKSTSVSKFFFSY
jgi:hypothetical protein